MHNATHEANLPSGTYPSVQQPTGALDPVAALIDELNRANSAGGLAGTLAVGALVFHHVFRGDASSLRRRGRKALSLRALAAQPTLRMSAASLWRAVACYELTARMPDLGHARHLGVGHVSVVLGLPTELQAGLLRAAEREQWTRAALQQKVRAYRPDAPRRGRPPVPAAVRSLRGSETSAREALASIGEHGPLDDRHLGRAQESLRNLESTCAALRQLLSSPATQATAAE